MLELPGLLLDNGTVLVENQTVSFHDYKELVILYMHNEGTSHVVLLILYVIVFLLAAVSNLLVIIVIYRFKHLHSVTNYFLVNLSVADLLVTTICMPIAMSQAITSIWFYGLFMCKFSAYLQGVAASSSVFSILAMSMDRYFAIRHPIVFRQFFNKRVARCVIFIIWAGAGLLFIPLIVVHNEEPLQLKGINPGNDMFICEICKETWLNEQNKRAFSVCCFTAVYALPVLLVLTAYVRMSCRLCTPSVIVHNRDGGDIILNRDSRLLQSRRRVARTLLILAFVFAACWLPYHIVQLVEDHLDLVQDSGVIKTVRDFSLWLAHANSAANPLLYCLFSRNIRHSLRNLFQPGSRNLRNSSEPLPLSRRRGHDTKKHMAADVCSSANHHHHPATTAYNQQAADEALDCGRDSIVVDRISPVTPPSVRRLLHPSPKSQFKTTLLSGKNRSLSKLVHLNHCAAVAPAGSASRDKAPEQTSAPSSYHSL